MYDSCGRYKDISDFCQIYIVDSPCVFGPGSNRSRVVLDIRLVTLVCKYLLWVIPVSPTWRVLVYRKIMNHRQMDCREQEGVLCRAGTEVCFHHCEGKLGNLILWEAVFWNYSKQMVNVCSKIWQGTEFEYTNTCIVSSM